MALTNNSMLTRRELKSGIAYKIRRFFFNSQVLPIVLTIFVILILFVIFRMRSVELSYKINDINKDIDQAVLENKEIKAKRAGLLSVNRLHKLSKKYGLSSPKQEQIIVIR